MQQRAEGKPCIQLNAAHPEVGNRDTWGLRQVSTRHLCFQQLQALHSYATRRTSSCFEVFPPDFMTINHLGGDSGEPCKLVRARER